MNRLKAATLALLFVACAPRAHANSDPVTVETKWNEKTVSITTTGVTSLTFDVGGFGAAGYAILGGSYTANGVDGTTYGSLLTITTMTYNVVGSDYVFYASATLSTTFPSLKIVQTLKTPVPNGIGIRNSNGVVFSSSAFNTPYPAANFFTAPVISTSTTITEPNGVLVQHTFRAKVANPIFLLTGLTSSATYMLTVDYLIPALQ